MQPSPTADTSRLLFPSLRFCIVSPCESSCSIILLSKSKHISQTSDLYLYSPECVEGKFSEVRLRASANRLRSAARSSFPAVAGPSFSDESPHDDDHLREGQPEVDDLLPALGTPYQLLVGILPGVGALHDPSSGRLEGRWPSPLGDLRDEPALQQSLAGKIGIVATIEADARVLRHQPERPSGV